MGVGKQTLYIKGEQSVEVRVRDVTLGDLISMEGPNRLQTARLKNMKILRFPEQGSHRQVVSVLKLVECIHKEYPELEVQNLGAQDILVTYEKPNEVNRFWMRCKIVVVCVISFVGAAFAIMAFNNDSGVSEVFSQVYEVFMKKPHDGKSILELTYCIGLSIGILLFFNHFGRKKFSVDPTPMEIEMRLYEKDIQTTLIENYSRRGQEMDAGKQPSSGSDRS